MPRGKLLLHKNNFKALLMLAHMTSTLEIKPPKLGLKFYLVGVWQISICIMFMLMFNNFDLYLIFIFHTGQIYHYNFHHLNEFEKVCDTTDQVTVPLPRTIELATLLSCHLARTIRT